jgi:NADH-ubiquinone oxidoreductase chain 5
MLILVTSNNFVQMFMGWEGVGLASYLLINFWHTRLQANKAAMKAIIVNKLGDFGLSLGLVMIFFVFHSFDYHVVFSLVPTVLGEKFFFFSFELDKITLITFFIFIGAVGKSAQIGLHTWLPDAMEGPTPVSALIHAATMVTAGVFVLLRCSPILEFSNVTLFIITVVGSLTAFMAATIGIVQNDIKKVIAYSTCSQLGYMVMACGLSNYAASLFHLMNHAFFKALLFLSAGVIIHAIGDEQDMRKLGGLVKILPVTYVCMLIGSLSLMGFPFFSGFYSKDMILEFAYGTYFFSGIFAYW